MTESKQADHSPEQKAAIEYIGGPQIILAGPGSGKTRVIVEKAAYLVEEKGYSADELLVLTYSSNTADELNQRIRFRQKDVPLPEASTFHAFGHRLVQRYYHLLGYSSPPELASDYQRYILMRQAYFKAAVIPPGLINPDSVMSDLESFVSRAADELVEPAEIEPLFQKWEANAKSLTNEDEKLELLQICEDLKFAARFYEIYERLKKENHLIDYGDMLRGAYKLLKSHKDILAAVRNKYRYILVDEFQDANSGQVEILHLIGRKSGKVCVVGDDDQSIYRFRGASYGSFINFQNKFPNTITHRLTINFRSSPPIVAASQALISFKGQERFDKEKKIVSNRQTGHKIGIMISTSQLVEAQRVKDLILSLLESKEVTNPNEIAVISRAHEHRRAIRRALSESRIPFQDLRPLSVFDIQDSYLIISMVRAILNDPRPDLIYPILAKYCRELSTVDYSEIGQIIRSNKPFEALKAITENADFPEKDRLSLKIIVSTIEELRGIQGLTPTSLMEALIDRTGLLKGAVAAGKEGETAVFALTALWNAMAEYEESGGGIDGLIDYLDWAEANGSIQVESLSSDGVKLITAHAAKGLEFPVVIVIGLSENRFPQGQKTKRFEFPQELSKEIEPPQDAHMQEERRLMYVAMTRAANRLYLSAIEHNRTKISRFIRELLEHPDNADFTMPADYDRSERFDNELDVFDRFEMINPERGLIESISSLKKKSPDSLEDNLTLMFEKLWQLLADAELVNTPEKFSKIVADSLARCSYVSSPKREWKSSARLRLSYTDLMTYKKCPLQYKFKKIYQIPEKVLPFLHLGNVMHSVLFESMATAKNIESITTEKLEKSFIEKWQKIRNPDIAWMESLKNAGFLMIHNFVKREKERTTKPIALEQRFEIELENCLLTGQIDRIDKDAEDELHLIDYKTGKIGARDSSFEKGDDQLVIYAIACNALFGGRLPKSAAYYYLADDREVPEPITPKKIDRVTKDVEMTAAEIAASQFPPKPNSYECGRCSYKNICPHKV